MNTLDGKPIIPPGPGRWFTQTEIDWLTAEAAWIRERTDQLIAICAEQVAQESVGLILGIPTPFAERLRDGLQAEYDFLPPEKSPRMTADARRAEIRALAESWLCDTPGDVEDAVLNSAGEALLDILNRHHPTLPPRTRVSWHTLVGDPRWGEIVRYDTCQHAYRVVGDAGIEHLVGADEIEVLP